MNSFNSSVHQNKLTTTTTVSFEQTQRTRSRENRRAVDLTGNAAIEKLKTAGANSDVKPGISNASIKNNFGPPERPHTPLPANTVAQVLARPLTKTPSSQNIQFQERPDSNLSRVPSNGDLGSMMREHAVKNSLVGSTSNSPKLDKNLDFKVVYSKLEKEISHRKQFPEGKAIENQIAKYKKMSATEQNVQAQRKMDTEILSLNRKLEYHKKINDQKLNTLEKLKTKMSKEEQVVRNEIQDNKDVPAIKLMSSVEVLANIIEVSEFQNNLEAKLKELEVRLEELESKYKSPEVKEQIALLKPLKEMLKSDPEFVKSKIDQYKNETIFIELGAEQFLGFLCRLSKNKEDLKLISEGKLTETHESYNELKNVRLENCVLETREPLTELEGICSLVYSSSHYSRMNPAMNESKGEELKEAGMRDLNKGVQAALGKCFSYELKPGQECLYRKVAAPNIATDAWKAAKLGYFETGGKDHQYRFTSSSTESVSDEITLRIYPKEGGNSFPTGKKFGFPYSLWPGEGEVLFMAGTTFVKEGVIEGSKENVAKGSPESIVAKLRVT